MFTRNQKKETKKQNAFISKNITFAFTSSFINTKVDQLMNIIKDLTTRINIIKVKFRFITFISSAPPASQSQFIISIAQSITIQKDKR